MIVAIFFNTYIHTLNICFFLGGGRGARDFENARARAFMRAMFYVVSAVRARMRA